MTLVADSICFRYRRDEPWMLDRISLTVGHGQHVKIIGQNGNGKTTLLKLLAGILAPEEGTISKTGTSVGFLVQRVGALPQWKVSECCAAWCRWLRVSVASVKPVWDRLELTAHWDQTVSQLSAGWQRRLAFARVFSKERQLFLLDEPEQHLDEQGWRLVSALIQEAQQRGASVVTTAPTGVSSELSQERQFYLREGRLWDTRS